MTEPLCVPAQTDKPSGFRLNLPTRTRVSTVKDKIMTVAPAVPSVSDYVEAFRNVLPSLGESHLGSGPRDAWGWRMRPEVASALEELGLTT